MDLPQENAKKIHICEICMESFLTNQHKSRHISIVHREEKKFECAVCSKTFVEYTRKHTAEVAMRVA